MDKWEYKFIPGQKEPDEFIKTLNDAGEEGWRVINSFFIPAGEGQAEGLLALMERKKN